jgi:hypothetical protein
MHFCRRRGDDLGPQNRMGSQQGPGVLFPRGDWSGTGCLQLGIKRRAKSGMADYPTVKKKDRHDSFTLT